ncbi:pyroglutamyl-peptidase 1 isoform X1 [Tachysurus fulvidraco]|uniref:pyroglutamyl-peptidase 1 isoform X1 n=2 Tax=Tachysurus fulvidraco TaxID=1234273 RepID=UPI000F4D7054|nr:pyroglutamyl-peptidase 1 isoform X1 [Tachysurus fulvidraco]
MEACKPELIVLTGFGPFRQYLVNQSWEAVKGLKRMGLGANIEIHIVEIPVCYSKAQQAIAEIWHNLKPKVAIHVGIASGTKCIILEQTGKNSGYKDRDVCGICPADNCCIQGGAERLDSIIDMRSIAKCLKGLGLDVIYSRDAGRYLCDFVLYHSLHYGQRRAALIHVPACTCLVSPERLLYQLQTIIQVMLCQFDAQSV